MNQTTPDAKRQGYVACEMNDLVLVIGKLQDSIERLHERINPILSCPTPASNLKPAPTDVVQVPPLAEEIRKQRFLLDDCCKKVNGIIQCVEL